MENLNRLVAHFWKKNTMAVTRIAMQAKAAAKLKFWPPSPRYSL